MEDRLQRIEDDMREMRAEFKEMRADISDIKTTLAELAATFSATLPHLATKEELEKVRHESTKGQVWAGGRRAVISAVSRRDSKPMAG